MPRERQRTIAYERGWDLGEALAVLFGPADMDIRAATTLGRYLAAAGGFRDVDPAFEFIQGFADGLATVAPPKQIPEHNGE